MLNAVASTLKKLSAVGYYIKNFKRCRLLPLKILNAIGDSAKKGFSKMQFV
jgi:hypothetical protein